MADIYLRLFRTAPSCGSTLLSQCQANKASSADSRQSRLLLCRWWRRCLVCRRWAWMSTRVSCFLGIESLTYCCTQYTKLSAASNRTVHCSMFFAPPPPASLCPHLTLTVLRLKRVPARSAGHWWSGWSGGGSGGPRDPGEPVHRPHHPVVQPLRGARPRLLGRWPTMAARAAQGSAYFLQ